MGIIGDNKEEHELFRNDWERVSDFLRNRTREINRLENTKRHQKRQEGSEYALPNIEAFLSQIALNQYKVFDYYDKDCHIHILPTPLFTRIVEGYLREILLENNSAFDTDNAYDIIETLRRHSINADCWTKEQYVEAIRNDAYCYYIKEENGKFEPSIIKLDLFRHIRENKKESKNRGHPVYEFVGGYFHALKHFALWGKKFTSNNSSILLRSPQELSHTLALLYFDNLGRAALNGNSMEFNHHMYNHDWVIVYYVEPTTNTAYLKSCHIKE